MTETQLGQTYTALAVATALVGQANASLFLAALSLALIIRQSDAAEALALIAQAERLTGTRVSAIPFLFQPSNS